MECARVLVTASVFASVALASTAALADDEGLRLAWSAPAGCPTADDVKSSTLRSVDRGKMLPGTLLADASVEQTAPNVWRVRLKTRRGDNAGEREIEGPTCAGVADATAVILALALVPPTTIEAPPPPPPPPVEPEKPKTAAPAPAPTNEHHQVAFGASFVGALGMMPKLGAGLAASVAWTPGWLRFEAEGKLVFGQTAFLPGQTQGAHFDMKGIGLRACHAVVVTPSFDLAPCLGFSVEVMTANGRGTAILPATFSDQSATEVWGSFAGGALGRVFLTPWLALRGRIEAIVPFSKPNFVVDQSVGGVSTGRASVHRPASVGGAGLFGAEVLFL